MREKQHQRGLSSGYLEPDRYDDEEEGEEAISLAAIKSKYKGGGLRGADLPSRLDLYLQTQTDLFFCFQRSEPGSTPQTAMKALMKTRPRG